MGALTLGPLVLSLDRAYAALGFLVLIGLAEIWARRGRPEIAAWGWRAAAAAFGGARLGFVLQHPRDYLAEPWSALAIWQGGFAPWWGVGAAAAITAWHARGQRSVRSVAPAIGLAALLAWWVPAGLLTPAPAAAGVTLPALQLETLDGAAAQLAVEGIPTVVNVWATWCPPCRRELPLLVAAAADTPDARILLVNQREAPETVRAYLTEQGLPEAGVLLDREGALGSLLQVAGLPTTFAFGADGRLVDLHVGELSSPALRSLIARVR